MEAIFKDSSKEGKEKHVPEIEVKKIGDYYEITVIVGKEVEHPNLPNHNINWVDIFYKPENGEVVHIARVDFKAHGEYNVLTKPEVKVYAKLPEKGKIIVMSYCTIHGVWINEKQIE